MLKAQAKSGKADKADSVRKLAAKLIKIFEDLRLTPYSCPARKLTIGYGHVIRESEKARYAEISPAEARELLLKDIDTARYAIYSLTRVPLSLEQEAALISFVFNCGSGAYQASTLRQKLNRGEYLWAADEFLRWVYCGSIRLAGLVRRREAERGLFLAGTV